jgi:integrase
MSIRKRKWTTKSGEAREAWIVDYVDQHGDRHTQTFSTRRAAAAWATQAEHEVAAGTHSPLTGSATVAEAFQMWIENCVNEGLEHGTIRQRRQHLKHHVAPFVGAVTLAELTLPRVNHFVTQLRAAGRSLAMRRKVLTNLKTAISHAQNLGLVAQNVARAAKAVGGEREHTRGPLRAGVDFPSKAELSVLLEHATERQRPFVFLLVYTGMRISELRGLRWRDIDLEAGIVHVRQRADAWSRMGPPKSKAGARDIPLAPSVVSALKRWRLACPLSILDLVFPNRAGRPFTLQNLRERLLPLQVKAGVVDRDGRAKYGFHAFRHAAASLFIENLHWPPKRVQAIMGHANISMTFDLYGHLFEDPEADRSAMARLEFALHKRDAT